MLYDFGGLPPHLQHAHFFLLFPVVCVLFLLLSSVLCGKKRPDESQHVVERPSPCPSSTSLTPTKSSASVKSSASKKADSRLRRRDPGSRTVSMVEPPSRMRSVMDTSTKTAAVVEQPVRARSVVEKSSKNRSIAEPPIKARSTGERSSKMKGTAEPPSRMRSLAERSSKPRPNTEQPSRMRGVVERSNKTRSMKDMGSRMGSIDASEVRTQVAEKRTGAPSRSSRARREETVKTRIVTTQRDDAALRTVNSMKKCTKEVAVEPTMSLRSVKVDTVRTQDVDRTIVDTQAAANDIVTIARMDEEPSIVQKPPNRYEISAGEKQMVVNPLLVTRRGNIDNMYTKMKAQFIDQLRDVELPSDREVEKPAAVLSKDKKVKFNDDKCVVFETNDEPTFDDADDVPNTEREDFF